MNLQADCGRSRLCSPDLRRFWRGLRRSALRSQTLRRCGGWQQGRTRLPMRDPSCQKWRRCNCRRWWAFDRLVLSFGDGEEEGSELFSKVLVGGTDEISSIFDKEEIKRLTIQASSAVCTIGTLGWQIIPVLIGFTRTARSEASRAGFCGKNAPTRVLGPWVHRNRSETLATSLAVAAGFALQIFTIEETGSGSCSSPVQPVHKARKKPKTAESTKATNTAGKPHTCIEVA